MQVKATAKGFYNSELKQPGDVFQVKAGEKASWFEPVRKKQTKKKSGNANAQEG